MGDSAADSASEGESRVERDAGELRRLSGLEVLLERVKLHRAGGAWGCSGSHLVDVRNEEWRDSWRRSVKLGRPEALMFEVIKNVKNYSRD